MTLTADRLREVLTYVPETGEFRWRIPRPACRPGDLCGRINQWGYREIGVDGTLYRACRLAVLYMTGSFPDGDVDHKDRRHDNDAWDNLRPCTRRENMANSPARSGIKGISWDNQRGRWLAQARIDGCKKNLGRHVCLGAAIAAHRSAVIASAGQFARFA